VEFGVNIVELTPSQYPWELLLLADPLRSSIDAYIEDCVVLGLTIDNTIAGSVAFMQTSEDIFEIMNIAVAPKYQSRGFAKQLIQRALSECCQRGARRVEIGTGNSSISQLALYQKTGFRIVGIISNFFMDNYPEPIIENGIRCRDMIRLAWQSP
jgi:ribosomal protein S18 acetylase RimI-like enzyme